MVKKKILLQCDCMVCKALLLFVMTIENISEVVVVLVVVVVVVVVVSYIKLKIRDFSKEETIFYTNVLFVMVLYQRVLCKYFRKSAHVLSQI